MSTRVLRGLVRAVLTEQRRSPAVVVVGLMLPVGTLAVIAAADILAEARGEVVRMSLPALLAVLLVVSPVGSLSSPLVAARERGVLRVLRTVPGVPGAILIAYTPLALAGVAFVVVAAGAALVVTTPNGLGSGAHEFESPGRWATLASALAPIAGLCGTGVALAAAVASVTRRTAAVRAVSTIAPAVVILAGGVLPLERLLPGLENALGLVPTTAMSRLLAEALDGGQPDLKPALLLCLASAVVWVLSVLRCRW